MLQFSIKTTSKFFSRKFLFFEMLKLKHLVFNDKMRLIWKGSSLKIIFSQFWAILSQNRLISGSNGLFSIEIEQFLSRNWIVFSQFWNFSSIQRLDLNFRLSVWPSLTLFDLFYYLKPTKTPRTDLLSLWWSLNLIL